MSIVVDLGCYDPTDEFSSISELIEAFHPETLCGFDVLSRDEEFVTGDTSVQIRQAAAWTEDGTVAVNFDGTGTRVGGSGSRVSSIDFSRWLEEHGPVAAVKMDIEGSEYQVLPKMHQDGTDALVGLLIIEWHGEKVRGLRCPTVPWWN